MNQSTLSDADLLASAERAVQQYSRLQRLGLIHRQGVFYPSILYPPFNLNPPITDRQLLDGYQLPADGLFSFYLNIPFCVSQCSFCHIPVYTSVEPADKARHLDAVERELDLLLERLGLTRLRARDMLLGGGTPTDLPPELLDRLLGRVTSRLELEACTQISCDLTPSSLLGSEGQQRLEILCDHGVQRLAFGVQDLDDEIRRDMGRDGDRAGVEQAVGLALERGIKVNIELICGYPGQTLASWADTVQRAVALGVDEIQFYRLQIMPYRERASLTQAMYDKDPAEFPSVEDTLRMMQLATELLQRQGYTENRRRFFTRTEADFSHYQDSWTGGLQDQLGVGVTAMCNLRDRYGQNTRDLHGYHEALDQGRLPTAIGMVRDQETQLRWAFCMPLRHHRADSDTFKQATGRALDQVFVAKVARLIDEGLLERWERGLRLTPLGSFFVDEVIQQFHHPDHLMFPPQAYHDGPLNPYRDNQP